MKTHYAECDQATEWDNTTYWSATACGLEYYEGSMSNRWEWVDCKHCLRKQQKESPKEEYSY